MDRDRLYKDLFELVGYMLTSARGLIDEPQLYGPFRLLDGVSRLCGFLEEDAGYDDFFSSLKKKIDERKFLVMTDLDGFVKLLDEAVMDYTRKMKGGNWA
jgi:hypothetical protein